MKETDLGGLLESELEPDLARRRGERESERDLQKKVD